MSLIRTLTDTRSLENPSATLMEAFGSDAPSSLPQHPVNADTAMRSAATWACARLLVTSVSSLPNRLLRKRSDGTRQTVTNDPRYDKVRKDGSPNPELTGLEFWELIMGGMVLRGNGYAYNEMDASGRTLNLWPLPPNQVTPVRLEPGKIAYRWRTNLIDTVLLQDEVIHYPAFRTDPSQIEGLSPIGVVKLAFALTAATEEYGARFFSQDARPGGVIEVPSRLSDSAYKRLRRRWAQLHQGARRSHFMAVLEEGATWNSVGIPPDEAQFLETRQFQRSEIAMIFGVAPHMIGDVDRSTSWGTGIEQQAIGFVVYNLRSWLTKLETKTTQGLFRASDKDKDLFLEWVVEGLLRGDTAQRFSAYAVGRQWGWLTVNDIRILEGLEPIGKLNDPDNPANQVMVPMNMQTLERFGAPPPPLPTLPPPDKDPSTLTEDEKNALTMHYLRSIGAPVGEYGDPLKDLINGVPTPAHPNGSA